MRPYALEEIFCSYVLNPRAVTASPTKIMVTDFAIPCNMDRAKRIWYLSPMRAAKVQASLRIRAVSPEPSLLAHRSSESRGTFRQKARSLAPLNGWACAVKMCHDGMLEDTNSLDGAHIMFAWFIFVFLETYENVNWTVITFVQCILKFHVIWNKFFFFFAWSSSMKFDEGR